MRTSEPLQGFIIAVNHVLIHLALIFAQPLCMYYFHSHDCAHETGHRLLGGTAAATTSDTGHATISGKSFCPTDPSEHNLSYLKSNYDKYAFLIAHCYCVFASVLTTLCYKCGAYEVGKLLDISRVPIYFYYIFRAQTFELNYIAGDKSCHLNCANGNDEYDLYVVWLILELRLFYGYILTGILFLTMS